MWKSPWAKRVVFALCLAPGAWLAYRWMNNDLGINSIEFVARYTGRWTLRLLLVTLAITPLRRIPGLSPLILFRRMLGLFVFAYATFHGVHYFARDAQWNWEVILEDLTYRRFFIAGGVAWLLLAPLAATSFDGAIRWMGGKKWQWLHRLIYLSALAAIIHYLWQAKSINLVPLIYLGVLVLLVGARVVVWLAGKKRS